MASSSNISNVELENGETERPHKILVGPEFKRPEHLLQSDGLYEYILKTSVFPSEPEHLREMRILTQNHPWGFVAISAEVAQFLSMVVKLMNAKICIEVGVFTGYSLLATAMAIPEDGKIIAIDTNKDNFELGTPIFEKAHVSHKVDFRHGSASHILPQLIHNEGWEGCVDFMFVDADKDKYEKYHEHAMKLVKVGGVIGYDNTLWQGTVVEGAPIAEEALKVRVYRDAVVRLNNFLAKDPRIEITQLPIGDGLTLCRRLF